MKTSGHCICGKMTIAINRTAISGYSSHSRTKCMEFSVGPDGKKTLAKYMVSGIPPVPPSMKEAKS